MGNSTSDAGHGALPTAGHDADRVGTTGKRGERHGSCPPDAGSQADAVWGFRQKRIDEDGGGNDGPWTPRKTNSRFPSAPTALGNRKLRDSHIPTAATKQWKSGKPKTGFPLSHCLRFAFYDQI